MKINRLFPGIFKEVTVPSVVNSVNVHANNTYKIGDLLTFTVNYSAAVTVIGTPVLPVTIGSTTVNATYVSQSPDHMALTFQYAVMEGDLDTDGIALDATIGLPDGATIRDGSGIDASLILADPSAWRKRLGYPKANTCPSHSTSG